MSAVSLTPHELVEWHASEFTTYAFFTLLIYDHCLTFHDEVEYFWKAGSFNTVQVLFALIRYGTPIFLAVDVAIVSGFDHPLTAGTCRAWSVIDYFGELLILCSSTYIVTLRIRALWAESVTVNWILMGVWGSTILSTLILFVIYLWREYKSIGIFIPGHTCLGSPQLAWTLVVPVTVFNGITFIFLSLKTIFARRDEKTPLVSILLVDGYIYFAVVFPVMVANLIVWRYASLLLYQAVHYSTWAITAVAICRLLLSLQKKYHGDKSPARVRPVVTVVESPPSRPALSTARWSVEGCVSEDGLPVQEKGVAHIFKASIHGAKKVLVPRRRLRFESPQISPRISQIRAGKRRQAENNRQSWGGESQQYLYSQPSFPIRYPESVLSSEDDGYTDEGSRIFDIRHENGGQMMSAEHTLQGAGHFPVLKSFPDTPPQLHAVSQSLSFPPDVERDLSASPPSQLPTYTRTLRTEDNVEDDVQTSPSSPSSLAKATLDPPNPSPPDSSPPSYRKSMQAYHAAEVPDTEAQREQPSASEMSSALRSLMFSSPHPTSPSLVSSPTAFSPLSPTSQVPSTLGRRPSRSTTGPPRGPRPLQSSTSQRTLVSRATRDVRTLSMSTSGEWAPFGLRTPTSTITSGRARTSKPRGPRKPSETM